MRVVFLCKNYGLVNRGVETYVSELSSRLKHLGIDVNIYPHSGYLSKVDIVISTNGRWDAIKAKVWCLVHNSKLIISGQSGLGWDDKLNLWLFPDIFVGLSDYQCQWAKSINPFVKVTKIPNGVDLQKFNPRAKPLKLNLSKPIILNVGVVTKDKRQYLLKQAIRGYSLLLVGKGGDMEFSHQTMPFVYTACDLFSYPTSPWESFGIAMLEAMASGLPVVATDDPIRREIVGNAGLFVDPTDSAAYARVLEKALNTNWGDKPRRQAAKFSWNKIAKLYDLCFHNCLK